MMHRLWRYDAFVFKCDVARFACCDAMRSVNAPKAYITDKVCITPEGRIMFRRNASFKNRTLVLVDKSPVFVGGEGQIYINTLFGYWYRVIANPPFHGLLRQNKTFLRYQKYIVKILNQLITIFEFRKII